MYTVFLPIDDDRKMELRCSTIKELSDLLDLYGLKPSGVSGGPVAAEESTPVTSRAAKAAPAAAISLTEQRLPFVKRALLGLRGPSGPKKIADALRRDPAFEMDSSDWPQAVRYILRQNKDVFVRGKDGWWVRGAPLPDDAQGSLIENDETA